MGSVQSEMVCPQCGGAMITDYYYKTDEEYRFCDCCGKYESWVIVRDQDGKAVRKKNGKFKFKHTNLKGYGCACIVTKQQGSTGTFFNKPIRKKDKDEFFRLLNSEDVDKANCYFTQWDDSTQKVISIYGQIPKYEE